MKTFPNHDRLSELLGNPSGATDHEELAMINGCDTVLRLVYGPERYGNPEMEKACKAARWALLTVDELEVLGRRPDLKEQEALECAFARVRDTLYGPCQRSDPRWLAACVAVRQALIDIDDVDYENTSELHDLNDRAQQGA
jgi:hypothetical protein